MRGIQKIFNFDCIGSKIKNLAKWSCWIEIIFVWIAAAIMFVAGIADGEALALLSPFAAIIASIVVWVGSWTMYAFGEFVEDTHAIRNKYYPTAEERAKQKAEEQAKREAEEKARSAREAQAAKREAEAEQLSISDIEDAASKYLKRQVSVSDISCTLIYVIPQSTGKPKEMHLDMVVGDQEFTSLDLFFDQRRQAYFFKGRLLALDGAWRSEEEIFGFDVALFKTFNTTVDEED